MLETSIFRFLGGNMAVSGPYDIRIYYDDITLTGIVPTLLS